MRGALRLGLLVTVTVVAGCTAEMPMTTDSASSATATSSESVTTSFNGLPIPADIAPVSASNPGPEAGAVLARCQIGDTVLMEEVAGMGKVPAAKDLTTFVPLTGREPQLKGSGPAWVVQIHGDVLQRGGEIWTDPTCVVTTNDSGYYATGPVKSTATGRVVMPEAPANAPTRGLPPLAP